jgi:hypothetical protein
MKFLFWLRVQVGRLRDFVSDNRLCRKRLNRLIDKEVALPSQRMEAHRIIAGNYLRAGMDADEEQAAHTAHHVRQWVSLTPPEHMSATLRVCTQWLRDRLHLDSVRMDLLEVRGECLCGIVNHALWNSCMCVRCAVRNGRSWSLKRMRSG